MVERRNWHILTPIFTAVCQRLLRATGGPALFNRRPEADRDPGDFLD